MFLNNLLYFVYSVVVIKVVRYLINVWEYYYFNNENNVIMFC